MRDDGKEEERGAEEGNNERDMANIGHPGDRVRERRRP